MLLLINTIGLSIGEIIAIMMMLSSLVATWVNARIKITKIETEMQIRFAKLEEEIANHKTDNAVDSQKFYKENREDHFSIGNKLDNVVKSLNELKIEMVSKTK
jgi:hypothetical protein